MSCPILVATAVKHHALPLFLTCVSALSIIVAIGIAVMPGSMMNRQHPNMEVETSFL